MSSEDVRLDPAKTSTVANFPRPATLKHGRTLLGLCTYYRKFIPDFYDNAEPLNDLLHGDSTFRCGPEQDEAYKTLKSALTPAPVLGHFVERNCTEVRTDASGHGISAVLEQTVEHVTLVVAYVSRTLSKCEMNYSITVKECLDVVWAVSKFWPNLYGIPFTIVTDHNALCWLASPKDRSGRLARWSLKLQNYDFSVSYKSGKQHLDADSLSRYSLSDVDFPTTPQAHSTEPIAILDTVNIQEEQLSDISLHPIITYFTRPTTDVSTRFEQRRAAHFTLCSGVLYRCNYEPDGRPWLLVVARNLQRNIIRANHNITAGHVGFAKPFSYKIPVVLE